jgi:predicted phage tail protein
MGNIHLDTFIQQYTAPSKKPNMLEIKFWDAGRNYEETTIAARTSNWDDSDTLNTPSSITLYGTTGYYQAFATARYSLLMDELSSNILSFGVDVDALAVEVGDIVEVQHDLLTTGESGRIVSVTSTPTTMTVVVDRTLTIASKQTYQFKVRHNDGTTDTKTVTGGSSTNSIEFAYSPSTWNKLPEAYEVYSFGLGSTNRLKYRVVNISRTSELKRTVTLMKHDPTIFDVPANEDNSNFTSYKLAPANPYLNNQANILSVASNVRLQEVLTVNDKTGRIQSHIAVSWDANGGDHRGSWEVWYRDVDVSDLNWLGEYDEDTVYESDDKVEIDGRTYVALTTTTTKPITI